MHISVAAMFFVYTYYVCNGRTGAEGQIVYEHLGRGERLGGFLVRGDYILS